MIASTNLNLDPMVRENLKNFGRYQSDDPQVQKTKGDMNATQPAAGDRYKLLKYVLSCKDKGHPYWRSFYLRAWRPKLISSCIKP
jgi:hypothetical protein